MEVVVLSPFEVSASQSSGYLATTSLAGTRINTELKDVGSAISVVTAEFLKDTGAVDNRTLLQYTTNTEVGSLLGNFVGARSGNQDEGGTFTTPNTNTRVRGLTSADNTRNFFLTSIPWNVYNVDRVDMQRGPNSILFGMGSPAGIINTSTKTAQFRNYGETEVRVGSYGSNRESLDINQVLIPKELAIRLDMVRDDTEFRQRPAYSQDERIFGALRYEPGFLNRSTAMTTSLKAHYESGTVRSNNPRVITPIDYITPWFKNMNKAVYNPNTVWDGDPRFSYDAGGNQILPNTYPDNYGQASSARSGQPGGQNPFYQPWLGNFGSSYGGLLAFYNPGDRNRAALLQSEYALIGGVNATGGIDSGIGSLPGQFRRVTVAGMSDYAKRANLPYSRFGLYKNETLTDPSIFDFYNNLLDGENKSEWQNFHNFQASLNQTFLNSQVGYEVAYDQQRFRRGQYSLLTDQRAGIYVDLNTTNMDGTPNPNVGKPLLTDAGIYGNSAFDEFREASRANLFVNHDFNRDGTGGWFRKLLGRHTLSGMLSKDKLRTDSRDFMRWGTDGDYARLVSNSAATMSIADNKRVVEPVVYLGNTSLVGASSAAGLHIPRAGEAIAMPYSGQMYYFNSTWRPPTGVNPGDTWYNSRTGELTTASENAANYVGFQNVPVRVLSAEQGDEAALTRNAALNQKTSVSKAAVWQAYFWDGAVVGMYGVRQDRVKSWTKAGPKRADASVDFGAKDATGALIYDVSGTPVIVSERSPSWSVVAKLNQLVGNRLPVDVNVYYSKSQNFQVSGTRYDCYGSTLAMPSGTTVDRGVMISTKDNRFSLRINKYESKVLDANSTSGLNMWLIGNNGDTLFTRGENAADQFQYHLGTKGDPSSAESSPWNWTYAPTGSETQAQADARAAAAVAGWRAFTANPVIQKALRAFGYSDFNVTQLTTLRQMPGFSITEDQLSRGYEIEFTANPTHNWRLTFNASKAEAIRSNVGGAAFQEYVNTINTALNNTPAGDIRIWWGGGVADTVLSDWNATFYSNYALARLQEGTVSPELRKWRFNLVTNYDFRTGWLKNVNVGLGYRWQDKIAIGYKPVDTSNPAIITYDLANPYYGPSEAAVDVWIGYRRKITDKINWTVQLNVRDALAGNELIPLTTQPNGSVAAWRIAPSRTWYLSNTFQF